MLVLGFHLLFLDFAGVLYPEVLSRNFLIEE